MVYIILFSLDNRNIFLSILIIWKNRGKREKFRKEKPQKIKILLVKVIISPYIRKKNRKV